MKKILLLKVLLVLLLVSPALLAQDRLVTGKVTAADDGAGLPGVNVLVKGTTQGTVTDANGNFSINAPSGSTLAFSFIGMQTKEVSVGDRTTFDISLESDVTQLSEVVVSGALGLTKQAKELGYAASTITSKELTQAKAVDVAQGLNGKISGVNITTANSGVFQQSKINIRGIRSLTGNNQPMLVVDGAQVPLTMLSQISPEDIADMTVLKSAASAAVYGSDAVNGVIVVTTKRGKSNQAPTININSSFQAARVAYFPKLQHDYGQGQGDAGYIDQYGNFANVPVENQLFGPRFDGTTKQIGPVLADGTFQTGPYSNLHKDDKKNFWNTGSTMQNSVSITGQDYFLSIQDVNVKGLMPDDKLRRSTVRFNGDKKIGRLSVNYGMGYTLQKSDVVNENALAGILPTTYTGSVMFAVMQTADNVPLLDYKDTNSKYGQFSNFYNEYAMSPYWVIKNLRSQTQQNNFIGNATLSYEIAPWLKATARFNTSINDSRTDNVNAPLTQTDFGLTRNNTVYTNLKGSVFNSMLHTSLANVDYFLNGQTKVGEDVLTVSYLVGGNYRETSEKNVAIQGNNLVVPSLSSVSVRSGDATILGYGSGSNIPYSGNPNYNYSILTRRASAYGTVGFGFKGWAFLEVTGRNDWDSRLAKTNRSYFYPGANLSLVLSDAIPSLKEGSTLSFLKLRAAYSKSANVNINPYSLQATYSQPLGFPFGNNVGFTAGNTQPSPNLKPESVLGKEVGLEFGLLDSKLDFEVTYFDQLCSNQILTTTLPISTGYFFGLANAASFRNKGAEFDLGIAPFNVGKGRLSFKINATYNTSKVTNTPDGAPVIIGGTNQYISTIKGSPTANNIAVVGGPAFQFQLSDYNRDPATGKVIVDQQTGYPSQATDLLVTGRNLPLWIVGFTPKFEIGGLSISMTWDYKTGHQFYSGLGADMDFAGISARSAQYGRQRFIFPNSVYKTGDGVIHENTNIQVQDGNAGFWTSSTANTNIATNYFASATAIRLREVNITYNVPQNWIASMKYIKKISVSIIGRNLLMLVPKSNQWGDPEFNYNAGTGTGTGNTFGLSSAFQTPASRLYGANLNLTF